MVDPFSEGLQPASSPGEADIWGINSPTSPLQVPAHYGSVLHLCRLSLLTQCLDNSLPKSRTHNSMSEKQTSTVSDQPRTEESMSDQQTSNTNVFTKIFIGVVYGTPQVGVGILCDDWSKDRKGLEITAAESSLRASMITHQSTAGADGGTSDKARDLMKTYVANKNKDSKSSGETWHFIGHRIYRGFSVSMTSMAFRIRGKSWTRLISIFERGCIWCFDFQDIYSS